VLIKITIIQYMFGIKSMRQTIKEIQTNVAYRWFLGFGFSDTIPRKKQDDREGICGLEGEARYEGDDAEGDRKGAHASVIDLHMF